MVQLPHKACVGKQFTVSMRNSEYASCHFATLVANGLLQQIETTF
jgi:hypothetical protein